MSGNTALQVCDTRQTREFIIDAIMAGLVPFVQSSPGLGKSSIIHSICDQANLKLIDHRLSTSPPEDLTGLPEFYTTPNGVRKARHAPFDFLPIEGDELPEGKEGWMLFLDEFNSAPKTVQAAGYKLILDKFTGQHRLHPNVLIVCAGNLATDRAIVNNLSTAMQSRLVHLQMEVRFNHFLEDVMLPRGWDDRIIAYLSYKRDALNDFRPDHNEKTFCCPRTWEFMNKLIKGKTFKHDENGFYTMEAKTPLYAGTITPGIATEFVQFTKIFDSIPKMEDVLADPHGIEVPQSRELQFAICTMLIGQVDGKNFGAVAEYLSRYGAEFRVLFLRGINIRKPELQTHPAYAKAAVALSRYLHD